MNNPLPVKPENQQESKSHLKNLVAIAFADQHMERSESDLLYRVLDRLQLDGKEVIAIMAKPEKIAFVPPTDPKEQFAQIYELVNMMLVDGKIDRRELIICKNFSLRLGFSEEEVEKLIRFIVDAISEGHSKEETLNKLITDLA